MKGKGTTGKIEQSQQFLLEDKLTFQNKISGSTFYHDINCQLKLNTTVLRKPW